MPVRAAPPALDSRRTPETGGPGAPERPGPSGIRCVRTRPSGTAAQFQPSALHGLTSTAPLTCAAALTVVEVYPAWQALHASCGPAVATTCQVCAGTSADVRPAGGRDVVAGAAGRLVRAGPHRGVGGLSVREVAVTVGRRATGPRPVPDGVDPAVAGERAEGQGRRWGVDVASRVGIGRDHVALAAGNRAREGGLDVGGVGARADGVLRRVVGRVARAVVPGPGGLGRSTRGVVRPAVAHGAVRRPAGAVAVGASDGGDGRRTRGDVALQARVDVRSAL